MSEIIRTPQEIADPNTSILQELHSEITRKKIIKFVCKLGVLPADAEDIVQEALLRADKAIKTGGYDTVKKLLPWLYAIAENSAITDYNRSRNRQKRREYGSDSVGVADFSLNPETILLDKNIHLTLAIEDLSLEYRQVIELRRKGLQYNEIATLLDIPIGTVRSRLKRAIDQLKLKNNQNTPT